MVILYVLAAMWAIGTLIVVGYFLNDMCDTRIGTAVGWCVVLPLWVLMGLGPIAFIKHESGPELASLLKSDWQCTAAHQETSTTYVSSGKVLTPITSTSTVCDQYGRH